MIEQGIVSYIMELMKKQKPFRQKKMFPEPIEKEMCQLAYVVASIKFATKHLRTKLQAFVPVIFHCSKKYFIISHTVREKY